MTLLPPSSLLHMVMRVTTKILREGTNALKPQLWGDSLLKHLRWVAEMWGWKPQGFCVSLPLWQILFPQVSLCAPLCWGFHEHPAHPGPKFDSHTSENLPLKFPLTWGTHIFTKLTLQQVLFRWNLQATTQMENVAVPSHSLTALGGRKTSATSVLKSFSTSAASSRDPMD